MVALLVGITLALDWQAVAGQALGGRAGAVVVLDVASGRRLAVVHPDVAARRRTRPGSVIKPFTLLALVQHHRVRTGTTLRCERRLLLAGRRMDCTHPLTPLPLDATAALAYSCNWWFASMATGLRADALAGTFRRVGLDTESGIVTVARDTAGIQLQALGEAGIEVTPLGLANAWLRLAQRRALPSPPDEGLALIYTALEAATEYGTARLAQPDGLRVAGKTGTTGDAAWFAGFAPAGRPRILVVVLVERGGGGADAAPVARSLFEKVRLLQ